MKFIVSTIHRFNTVLFICIYMYIYIYIQEYFTRIFLKKIVLFYIDNETYVGRFLILDLLDRDNVLQRTHK